ncbi:DUF58 domain-containing protein [Leucobacter soli]|uniref:DUF58 domain-containing protein n=1 Tax=Leucobacter soli TaxID=2812850 RepID=UPI0036066BDB
MREYAHGDALRHVHWKSTAKTGTLMVRQFEESQTARVAVLFDALREEYASDDEFELGVSVAASLSVQAVREGVNDSSRRPGHLAGSGPASTGSRSCRRATPSSCWTPGPSSAARRRGCRSRCSPAASPIREGRSPSSH